MVQKLLLVLVELIPLAIKCLLLIKRGTYAWILFGGVWIKFHY